MRGRSRARVGRERVERILFIYDGFSIYDRILCLAVKRRDIVKGKETCDDTGQAMMEEWIASTHIGEGQMKDE